MNKRTKKISRIARKVLQYMREEKEQLGLRTAHRLVNVMNKRSLFSNYSETQELTPVGSTDGTLI